MFILHMSLKIAYFELQPHLPGGQEVNSYHHIYLHGFITKEHPDAKIRCNEFKLKNIGHI